ncbi:MAG: hypothetical protein KBD21_01205 [Candidatus Pacebacteria bacterium]|nr:hypothetical protein [Candidatus Paceibacterota bacterium]
MGTRMVPFCKIRHIGVQNVNKAEYSYIIITEVRQLPNEGVFKEYCAVMHETYPDRVVCEELVREIIARPDYCLFMVLDCSAKVIGTGLLVRTLACDGVVGVIRDVSVTHEWSDKGVERALLENMHRYGMLVYGVERFESLACLFGAVEESTYISLGYTRDSLLTRYTYRACAHASANGRMA